MLRAEVSTFHFCTGSCAGHASVHAIAAPVFSTPLVFHKTLLSFRSAVLRYAQTIRIL